MSVKIRKLRRKWYVVVDYQKKRKSKAVGIRESAEKVRRAVELRLAQGDTSFFAEPENTTPTFEDYAKKWLEQYAKHHSQSVARQNARGRGGAEDGEVAAVGACQ
jgi:hypothetical protein